MSEDELTGLHDRRTFLLALRRQIGLANEKQSSLALLIVDIDGFAAINGTYGYEFGDKVLKFMALQLRQVARTQDYVARIGDNRFALILPRIMNRGHAELAVQKLFRLLDLPIESGQARVKVSVTVGVAMCPLHATHAEFLLRLAERSLLAARADGQHCQFPPDVDKDDSLSEFWDIEIELHGAVQRGEMHMHYQPKVGCMDHRPVGAEALVRWDSRSRGAVGPDLFIPVAERTGQIKALTIWAMNTALRQASEWKHPFGELSVAVNVPADLVVLHDLPDLVENALKLWGRDHVQLVLEITERSLVVAPEHSFRILSRIRDMGVKVSIDDFGTGYSCLAYFKNIPADELKIDKSFVSGLLKDAACAEITSVIIDLAHRFGLSVVAEGVEDEATLRVLQQRHCDVVQGYLFGKAMPCDAFQHWLDGLSGAALGVAAR
jgi:diguanylate cyclase (GGDEF)-like protein